MIAFAEWSLWLAVMLAGATVILSFAGGMRGRAELVTLGRASTYATFATMLVVALGIWTALFAHDFSLRLVASNTSLNLPRIYTVAALWASHQGSLLLWTLILSGCAAVAVFSNRHAHGKQIALVAGTLGLLVLCFLVMMLVGANPFARLGWVPGDGLGMSPRLQVPAMLLQPLLMAKGLVASSVPFAFTVGALVTRRFDAQWTGVVKRWSLLAWFLLTVGVVLGLRWDYTSPDWSGYWRPDAARDSALLPWLSGTALLVVLKSHANNGRSRTLIAALAIATFVLSLFSAYVARSGMVDSIHAYTRSPVADGFLALAAVAVLASIHLVRTRRSDLEADKDAEPTEHTTTRGVRAYLWYLPMVAGAVAMCVGLSGPLFRKEARETLASGDAANVVDAYGRAWTFTSQGISSYTELNRQVLVVSASLARDGHREGVMISEQRRFMDWEETPISEPITVVALRSSPRQDIRFSFRKSIDRSTALVQIEFVPLVWWVWFGGILMAIGGVIVMMSQQPKRDDETTPARVSDDDVEAAIRRASATLVSCGECGPRPEPDAIYCSNCGAKLVG